ncbi:hypothetical protein F511_30988 [Dorcoceras hygrometricum]|uniref:Uncharacterized protein n=1 Tax=Dorcoceras hygrometricum TaxID=472368 RepID=A0A2Z7BEJ5_9LAMI|nr:hypothetical protein F511_30988 [Dorcoceras hygrometricum]
MAMVTEPLFASAANALGNVDNISTVPKELKGMEIGLLEVKHWTSFTLMHASSTGLWHPRVSS